jgi:hypothetical protein
MLCLRVISTNKNMAAYDNPSVFFTNLFREDMLFMTSYEIIQTSLR